MIIFCNDFLGSLVHFESQLQTSDDMQFRISICLASQNVGYSDDGSASFQGPFLSSIDLLSAMVHAEKRNGTAPAFSMRDQSAFRR
jgi:hypothetical protein